MIFFYDRQGKPLTDVLEWAKLTDDDSYQRLAQDTTPGGVFWISTVWMGIDHSHWFGTGQNPHPIIFETMVFDARPENQLKDEMLAGIPIRPIMEQERYSTEAEAIGGHAVLLKKYQDMEIES